MKSLNFLQSTVNITSNIILSIRLHLTMIDSQLASMDIVYVCIIHIVASTFSIFCTNIVKFDMLTDDHIRWTNYLPLNTIFFFFLSFFSWYFCSIFLFIHFRNYSSANCVTHYFASKIGFFFFFLRKIYCTYSVLKSSFRFLVNKLSAPIHHTSYTYH